MRGLEHTYVHTDRHHDYQTKSAQWTDLVKMGENIFFRLELYIMTLNNVCIVAKLLQKWPKSANICETVQKSVNKRDFNVSVLLSAPVKRFSVGCMRGMFYTGHQIFWNT